MLQRRKVAYIAHIGHLCATVLMSSPGNYLILIRVLTVFRWHGRYLQ